MVDDSGVALTVMKVDGGITANSLCMQLQSDVMQIDISRPTINETTALGAAYAAGLFTNFFSSQDQLRQMWQESARWSPDKNSALAVSGYRDWKRAIERTLDWV
jgi:glycerol kinase